MPKADLPLMMGSNIENVLLYSDSLYPSDDHVYK